MNHKGEGKKEVKITFCLKVLYKYTKYIQMQPGKPSTFRSFVQINAQEGKEKKESTPTVLRGSE